MQLVFHYLHLVSNRTSVPTASNKAGNLFWDLGRLLERLRQV